MIVHCDVVVCPTANFHVVNFGGSGQRIVLCFIFGLLLISQLMWYNSMLIDCQEHHSPPTDYSVESVGINLARQQNNQSEYTTYNEEFISESANKNNTNITSSVYDDDRSNDQTGDQLELLQNSAILPAQFDWRLFGKVSRVKDQGSCNACYAFAATSSIESALAIHYNIDLRNSTPIGNSDIYPTAVHVRQLAGTRPLVDAEHISVDSIYNLRNIDLNLSEQELIDCTSNSSRQSGKYSNQACSYGFIEETFRYIIQNGLVPASQYPYTFNRTKCKTFALSTNRTFIHSYRALVMTESNLIGEEQAHHNLNIELTKRLILTNGPIISLIKDQGGEFFNYRGGIIRADGATGSQFNPSSFKHYNHAILIVGWGVVPVFPVSSTNSTNETISHYINYWIVKNSWSTDWGESGFARIEFGARGVGRYLYFPILFGPQCTMYNYYSTVAIYVLLAVLIGSMLLFYGLILFFNSKLFTNRRKYVPRLIVKFRRNVNFRYRHSNDQYQFSQPPTSSTRPSHSSPSSWAKLHV